MNELSWDSICKASPIHALAMSGVGRNRCRHPTQTLMRNSIWIYVYFKSKDVPQIHVFSLVVIFSDCFWGELNNSFVCVHHSYRRSESLATRIRLRHLWLSAAVCPSESNAIVNFNSQNKSKEWESLSQTCCQLSYDWSLEWLIISGESSRSERTQQAMPFVSLNHSLTTYPFIQSIHSFIHSFNCKQMYSFGDRQAFPLLCRTDQTRCLCLVGSLPPTAITPNLGVPQKS